MRHAGLGLLLEIVALAKREPRVAEALRVADERIRAELGAWLLQAWEQAGCRLTAAEARERVFLLQCFVEGLVIRSIKQPDSDHALLKNSLRPLLAWLLARRPGATRCGGRRPLTRPRA